MFTNILLMLCLSVSFRATIVAVDIQTPKKYFGRLPPCLPLSILHMAAALRPTSRMARSWPDTLRGVLDRLLSVRGRGVPLNGGRMVFAALIGSERGKWLEWRLGYRREIWGSADSSSTKTIGNEIFYSAQTSSIPCDSRKARVGPGT
ncbi:hypothetical protein JB92DRAFT_2827272 [Gautieria morchelliformis]|nr:hypothetical protein JB92DRAFT_2827272 [Gautieria morchelliformis]